MTETDYMRQEKKKEEDSPALMIESIHRSDDSKTTWKRTTKDKLEWLEKARTTNWSTEKQLLGIKKEKKNNCMDISSDKQAISHTKRPRHG